MRIAICGVGGIGGPLAAFLLREGRDVTLVTGSARVAEAIARDGLRVTGRFGNCVVRTPNVATELYGIPYDSILLATRSDALEPAARAAIPFLKPDGFVVTLQNGIPEPRAQKIVGADRVLGAVVGYGGTMHAPGVYEVTGGGGLTIGEVGRPATPRVRALAEELSAAVSVRVTDNLAGARWTKLALNCALSSLGAALGLTAGEMVAQASIRRAFFTIVSEVVDVADAEGVKLEPLVGLDLKRLYLRPGGHVPFAAEMLLRAAGFKYRRVRSGMLQRLEQGRPTGQIDDLSGFVALAAVAHGLAAPLNALTCEIVKSIERGEATIGLHHLPAIAQRLR